MILIFDLEEIKKECRKDFENHIATIKSYQDDLAVLIWANPGTYYNYVRYVFDKCMLYITGDLGDAVVRLTETANLKNLSTYTRSIPYFIEKIQCASDIYCFDEDVAVKKLCEEQNTYIEDVYDDNWRRKIQDLFNELIVAAKKGEFERLLHNEDFYYRITEIDPDAFEWIPNVGRVYSRRLILWLVGLQMAYEQIEIKQ